MPQRNKAEDSAPSRSTLGETTTDDAATSHTAGTTAEKISGNGYDEVISAAKHGGG